MRRPTLLGLLIAGCTPTIARPPGPAPTETAAPKTAELPPVLEGMLEDSGPPDQAPPPAKPAIAPLLALQPKPGLRKVLEVRGWDVVAAPGRVIVLDDDFVHVRALDAATGAELWRSRVQEQPNGRHTLFPVGDRVLLYAGPSLIAIDVRDGRVVGRHASGGYHGGDTHCGLHVVRELETPPWRGHVPADSDRVACAVACDCFLAPVRCDTGAPETSFRSSETHLYHSLSEPHETVCWRPPRLLGRVKGRTLVALEDEAGGYTAAAVVGDKVAWRAPALGDVVGRFRQVDGDAASDACWSTDGAQLVVWTCSTGQVRWRAEYDAQDGHVDARARLVAGGRLLVQLRGQQRNLVELRPLAGGKPLWRRSLATDRRIVLPGAPVDAPAWDAPTTYALVDLASSATRAEIPLAVHEALLADPRGGWIRVGAAWTEFDADGRERRAVPKDMSKIAWVGEKLAARSEEARFSVLRRSDLEVVLEVAAGMTIAESRAALGPDALLVYEHRGDEPLRIALLRAE